jgi:O-antigen ligase
MVQITGRSTFRAVNTGTLLRVVMAALIFETLAVTTFLAMGRLEMLDAIFYVIAPWAVLAAALRPDWLLLGLVAMPANVSSSIQTRRILLLVAAALVALLLTRQQFSFGLRTGLASLFIINLAGHLFLARVDQDALAVNQEIMLVLTYYLLLALLAFNLAKLEELDGELLGAAIVVGVATTVVVGLTGFHSAWFPGGPGIITRTYLAPLVAGAFGVTAAYLFLPSKVASRRVGAVLLTGLLLFLTVVSRVRAVWIAVAITLALLAFRSGKRGYLIILVAAIVLALLTPTARQEVSRSESGDIIAELRSGDITTGRWTLWTQLWGQAQVALPWGNGFGHVWSLSSQDLFGAPGEFQSDESGVVPPHNDFLYLLVEFGVPGLLLLLFFWVKLFRAQVAVANSRDPSRRRSGWLLLGMLVTGLMVALIDDLFAVRPLAERFFPVAGFIFGLAELERAQREGRAKADLAGARRASAPAAWRRSADTV